MWKQNSEMQTNSEKNQNPEKKSEKSETNPRHCCSCVAHHQGVRAADDAEAEPRLALGDADAHLAAGGDRARRRVRRRHRGDLRGARGGLRGVSGVGGGRRGRRHRWRQTARRRSGPHQVTMSFTSSYDAVHTESLNIRHP